MNIKSSLEKVDGDDEHAEYHAIPAEDILSHWEHYRCPCQPDKQLVGLTYVFIHKELKDCLQ